VERALQQAVANERSKSGILSVYEQERAEFFGEINYYPNECQELIHRTVDEHRRIYVEAPRRSGLTVGLVFEALWQAQREAAQVVLVAPNFIVQMIHRRMLLELVNERDRLYSEFLSYNRHEEIRFTGGRAIISVTVSTIKGLLGRPLTAVLYDDAERGNAWPWTELEKILAKNDGCAIAASQARGVPVWLRDWIESAHPHEIIYPGER